MSLIEMIQNLKYLTATELDQLRDIAFDWQYQRKKEELASIKKAAIQEEKV